MPDRTPRIPEAELDVLVALRRHGPQAAADLVRLLASTRPLTHGSVSTLLGRLERRGLVTRRKAGVGKTLLFSASVRAEGAVRGTVRRLVTRICGDDRMVAVASLLESAPLDEAELARLEQLVTDLAAARRRKTR